MRVDFTKDQWYTLTYVYSVYTNADGATAYKLQVYIDNTLFCTTETTNAASVVNSKATTNPLINGIVGIEAKSKNLKDNFECINIYFDDTTLYKTTEAPVFEIPEVSAE